MSKIFTLNIAIKIYNYVLLFYIVISFNNFQNLIEILLLPIACHNELI